MAQSHSSVHSDAEEVGPGDEVAGSYGSQPVSLTRNDPMGRQEIQLREGRLVLIDQNGGVVDAFGPSIDTGGSIGHAETSDRLDVGQEMTQSTESINDNQIYIDVVGSNKKRRIHGLGSQVAQPSGASLSSEAQNAALLQRIKKLEEQIEVDRQERRELRKEFDEFKASIMEQIAKLVSSLPTLPPSIPPHN